MAPSLHTFFFMDRLSLEHYILYIQACLYLGIVLCFFSPCFNYLHQFTANIVFYFSIFPFIFPFIFLFYFYFFLFIFIFWRGWQEKANKMSHHMTDQYKVDLQPHVALYILRKWLLTRATLLQLHFPPPHSNLMQSVVIFKRWENVMKRWTQG